jgi:hypothetical protein
MIRITTLLWLTLLVVAGGTAMQVSNEFRRVEKHRADIVREIHDEQYAIGIYRAEWSTLINRRRIDDLSHRYLSLEATPVRRVVTLDSLPFRTPGAQPIPGAGAPAPITGHAPGGEAMMAQGGPMAGQAGQRGKERMAPKAQPAAPAPRPEILARAVRPTPAPVPALEDGVGLILARLEKR